MNLSILSIQFSFSGINQNSIIIAIVGYVIVFIALVSLYFVFSAGPKMLNKLKNARAKNRGQIISNETDHEHITGEVNAAISTALFLYFNELHDEESQVMTIERVSRNYSPWSSKIYSVRNFFNRR